MPRCPPVHQVRIACASEPVRVEIKCSWIDSQEPIQFHIKVQFRYPWHASTRSPTRRAGKWWKRHDKIIFIYRWLSAFLCIDMFPVACFMRRASRARAVSSPRLVGRASSRVASPTPTTATMLNPSTAGTSIPRKELVVDPLGHGQGIQAFESHRSNRFDVAVRAGKAVGRWPSSRG